MNGVSDGGYFMKRFFSIILMLFFMSVSAIQVDAKMYKWRDENGKLHFTDNPANIPKNSEVETREERYTPDRKKDQKEKAKSIQTEIGGSDSALNGQEPKEEAEEEVTLEKLEHDVDVLRKRLTKAEDQIVITKRKYRKFKKMESSDSYEDENRASEEYLKLEQDYTQAKKVYWDLKKELQRKESETAGYRKREEEKARQNE
mgnify:CR=1 FL=1